MVLRKLLLTKDDRLKAVDVPFLLILLTLLTVGLVMLYSASSAQSAYDTGYTDTTRYLQKQAVCALIGLGAMQLQGLPNVAIRQVQ